MPADFRERSSGREPSGRFGVDVAEYVRTYVLDEMLPDGTSHAPLTQALTDRITKITGTTLPGPSPRPFGAPGGAGSLDRVMPMADPQFPGLFGDVATVQVASMEGYRADFYGGGPLAVMPTEGFSRYMGYEITVNFSARPFAVLPNEKMTIQQGLAYAADGHQQRVYWYPEMYRYTQTFADDLDAVISAAVSGGMKFRVPSKDGAHPDGAMPNQIPSVVVPDQSVRYRVYQLPLRYLTSPNSHLVKLKGTINQWPLLGRNVGSMLYVGPKVVRVYTPPQFAPTQQQVEIDGFRNILQGSFYAEPLIDVDLSFVFTARERAPAGSPDPDSIPDVERPNKNWLDAGHNLMLEWSSKRWHYVHASTLPDPKDYARWVPTYVSAVHQLLWQDPDVSDMIFDL